MQTIIYCSVNNSMLNFYAKCDGGTYYLFSHKFRRGVYNFYKCGIPLNKALDHSKSHFDTALMKVMDKMPSQIAFVEKDYGISIMTKKHSKNKRNKSNAKSNYNYKLAKQMLKSA